MLTKGSALHKPKAKIQLSGIVEEKKGTCIFPISAGSTDDGVDMTRILASRTEIIEFKFEMDSYTFHVSLNSNSSKINELPHRWTRMVLRVEVLGTSSVVIMNSLACFQYIPDVLIFYALIKYLSNNMITSILRRADTGY